MVVYNNILAGASGVTTGDAGPSEISRSLRFNSGDSSHLSRTPASAGNRKTWTWSGWVKRSILGTEQALFGAWSDDSNRNICRFNSSDQLQFLYQSGGTFYGVTTTQVYRDPSAWFHLVFVLDTANSTEADRAQIYVNGSRIADADLASFGSGKYPPQNTDYTINNTVAHHLCARKESGSLTNTYGNKYLADVHFIDGQALAATDFGVTDSDNNWNPKAYSGTYGTNGFRLNFNDITTNQALGYDASVDSPAVNNKGGFDAVLYSGTGSDQTIKGLAFQPDLVWIKTRNESENHFIVDSVRGVTKQLYANSNGQEYTNSNRFKSFNSNGFTVGTTDDTNQSGNSFVAWAWKAGGTASSNTDGSITSQVSASDEYGFSVVSYTGATNAQTVGHGLSSAPKFIIAKNRDTSSDWIVYHESLDSSYPEDKFQRLNQANATTTSADYWGSGGVTNSVFGVDNGILINSNGEDVIAYCWSEVSGYSKFSSYTGNGSTSGPTVTTGFKPRYVLLKHSSGSGNNWMILDSARAGDDKLLFASSNGAENTGTDRVRFTDTGFQILDSSDGFNTNGQTYIYAAYGDRAGNNWTPNNLIATAGLETASQGMDVVTYTGNGSTQSISGLNFQPDFVWIKARSTAMSHHLFDVVRGNTKAVISDSTASEYTNSNYITSFDSNGFSLGNEVGVNQNTTTYAAWAWKAGGTTSSNTDGTITSSVSANQTYGFSVVKYTGTGSNGTVGHGLNSAPEFFFGRNLDDTSSSLDWIVYHQSVGNTGRLKLNSTGGSSISSTFFQDTSPSNSVITIGTSNDINKSSDDYVMYCWSEVPGFSKFGTYTGNGSATGPVIITGFKPRFVLVKGSSYASNWNLIDTARSGSNPRSDLLRPNSSGAESSSPTGTYGISLDVLDDGFQLKSGSSTNDINQTDATYIYAAFADKPPGEIIDSLIDTPTDITADSGNNPGNYATMNPLDKDANCTLSNGNLDVSCSSSGWFGANATMQVIEGKTYFEATYVSGSYVNIGLNTPNTGVGDVNADGVHLQNDNGTWRVKNGSSATNISAVSANSIIGVAVDTSANTIQFFVNGTSVYSGTLNALHRVPMVYGYGTYSVHVNFGQRPFAYTAPSGFKALCTTNLPDPTIADGSTYFDALTYTGSSSPQTVSGLNFASDLIWIKSRSHTAWHILQDSVRGFGKTLFSNDNNAEIGDANDLISNVTATGFSVNTTYNSGTDTATTTTSGSNNYVAWAWDAGSSTVSNTDGSITSSVRANPSAGFSIVTYTGTGSNATIGHGLNAAPQLYITKRRDGSNDWETYHGALGATYYGKLNATDQFTTAGGTSRWNDTEPTSSVFSVATSGNTNGSGNTYVAYCFAPVEGYSAFGSYTGNGSSDGPFVFTGFRPAFLLWKNADNGNQGWNLMDSTRDPANTSETAKLYPESSAAENGLATANQARIDLLSNGFKIRDSGGPINDSGDNYIWVAFAENPFKTARAR